MAVANIISPVKFGLLYSAYKSGMSIRKAARHAGVQKRTSETYLRSFREKFGVILCSCGTPAGHKGWCSALYAQSPARQAWLKTIIRPAAKPRLFSSVGTVFREEFALIKHLPRCHEKGCPFICERGTPLCAYHNHCFDFDTSLIDRATQRSDYYAYSDSSVAPHLTLLSPKDFYMASVNNPRIARHSIETQMQRREERQFTQEQQQDTEPVVRMRKGDALADWLESEDFINLYRGDPESLEMLKKRILEQAK